MAKSGDGKFPKESWPQSIKDKAQRLYTREGKSIAQISTDIGVPVATLQRWAKQENWRLEKWSLAAIGNDIVKVGEPVAPVEENGTSIEPVRVSSALESEARENLLKGLKLLGSVGEEALKNDKLKFRDKKQAADVMLGALRGEVEIESTRLTTEFLREIAIAIQEEVKDEETLRRLAIRLTAIGKVFDTRILAK
jgi:transposase-like protein